MAMITFHGQCLTILYFRDNPGRLFFALSLQFGPF